MGEVVELGNLTTLPIPTEKIISKAATCKFDRIIIIGLTADGEEYFASSEADGGCILWDMERAKFKLMNIAEDLA
jgi:hypothetical protein